MKKEKTDIEELNAKEREGNRLTQNRCNKQDNKQYRNKILCKYLKNNKAEMDEINTKKRERID